MRSRVRRRLIRDLVLELVDLGGDAALVLPPQEVGLTLASSIVTPRVYRIPFSTNVERVAIAAGHKGIAIEWVDVDPATGRRSSRSAASGSSRCSSTATRRSSTRR